MKILVIVSFLFLLNLLGSGSGFSVPVYDHITPKVHPWPSRPSKVPFTAPLDESEVNYLTRALLRAKAYWGAWNQCGVEVPKDKWEETAEFYVRLNLYYAKKHGVNPVGQMATWEHESLTDPCGLGIGPRKWAYKRGLLKRKRRSCSHTPKELRKLFKNEWFRTRWPQIDIGLAQLLYPTYTHGKSFEEVITPHGGAEASSMEMELRAKQFRLKKPWITWQGLNYLLDRDRRINWWVRNVMKIQYDYQSVI